MKNTATPYTQAVCDLPFETWEEKSTQLQSAMQKIERALLSARDELKRQREIWTGTKNDAWAVATIDTELRRIDDVLSSANDKISHAPSSAEPTSK